MSTYTQEDELLLEDVVTVEESRLVIYNDDVNTFDHVIDSLISVCGHDPLQAEQCTLIIHYKGKCEVKMGNYDKLEPMCVALHDRGLSAEIQ
ncbi:MAG: ATP-dependent Clp protease adaptor ClpS [Flavobacteriales bacterium]